MTLQWTAVALFLYGEIALNLLLCVPFVSAKRCGSLQRWRLEGSVCRTVQSFHFILKYGITFS